jgi:TRAP-type C4-dicarboxylate transport system permease small subunit
MNARPVIARLIGVQGWINVAAARLAGLALLLMMFAGAADVIATNADVVGLPSRPIPSTNDFMATMMVAAVFLGLALAQQRRAHIQVTLGAVLEGRFGRLIGVVRHLLHGLFYALIAGFGWSAAMHSVTTGEFAAGLVDFPVWPARLALAVGASLMTLQCLLELAAVILDVPDSDERAPLPPAH